jgi:hypothetical protein
MAAPIGKLDPNLTRFATETQSKYILATIEAGSIGKAAKKCGVDRSAVSRAISAAKRRAAMAGLSPEHDMTHEAPAPFVVKGISTLYGEDGKPKAQWVKTALNDQAVEQALHEAIEFMVRDAKGLSPLVRAPKHTLSDLLATYPLGDPHIGMYAWKAEAGEDFDLEIAERETLAAMDRLIDSAPAAETAIFLPLGDNTHANDQTNRTPLHGYQLDVDSRYPKVLTVAIKVFRHIILRALEKHQKVVVRVEPGNHDPQVKWAITMALAAYFDNNSRVEIDLSPSKFWYYRFNQVLIGSTHGDTVKQQSLGAIMAADRPKDWGETKFRYWYTGHVHHKGVIELPGVLCESFRTLAPSDAHANSHGYRSGRDAYCIVHHKDYGEIERHRCDVAMVK